MPGEPKEPSQKQEEKEEIERVIMSAEKYAEQKTEGKIEITAENFQFIIDSKRFLQVIRRAANETKNSGMESGFDICIFEDKSFVIPGVELGSAAGMGASGADVEFVEGKPLDRGQRIRKHSMMGFHFHPTEGVAIVPSGGDLTLLSTTEKYGVNSLIGVCQAEKKGIKILLIRSKKGVHIGKISDLAESYEDEMDKYGNTDWLKPKDQGLVSEALEANGFDSISIFFKSSIGKYVLD